MLAAVLLTLGAAAIELGIRPPGSHPPLPSTVSALSAHIASHPTDWLAACALTEKALDVPSTHRIELWHAAHAHALMLAPNRPEPQEAFVRSGFFHWNEIDPADRNAVLAAVEPMLRDPSKWFAMAGPIFDLTGDLAMLRRARPPGDEPTVGLLHLAASRGRFEDYRSLRREQWEKRLIDFKARATTATGNELIQTLPQPPYRKDSEPLIAALLDQLHDHPLVEDPLRPQVLDGIIEYALQHSLGPLDGLEVIARRPGAASPSARMRLAKTLGISQSDLMEPMPPPSATAPPSTAWKGLCGTLLCERGWRKITSGRTVSVKVASAEADEVPPYVEIYLDDALVSEGEVSAARTFVVAATPGVHHLELLLANPRTRNGGRRQVRLLAVSTP